MSLFSDNPVLRRELRGRLRLRQPGKVSVSLSAVVALVIVYFYARGLQAMWRGPADDAQMIWSYLAVGLLLLIVLLAPALTATAITQEREQQTWEILAITRLTAGQILIGKWLARQSVLGLMLLVALPFLIGSAIRGHVPPGATLGALLFLVLTTGFFSLLGLWCSYRARRTAVATAAALSLTAFFCLGTLVISGVLQLFFPPWRPGSDSAAVTVPLWFNPFYALGALVGWLTPAGVGFLSSPPAVHGVDYAGETVAVYAATFVAAIGLGLSQMIIRYRETVQERTT